MSENFNNSDQDNNELFRLDRVITVEELAEIVIHDSTTNKLLNSTPPRFSLFLGAGASKSSKIKLGWEMIKDFVETIFERECEFLKNEMKFNEIESLKNSLNHPDLSQSAKDSIQEKIYKTKMELLQKQTWFNKEESDYSNFFKRCFRKEIDRRDYIKKIIEPAEITWGYIQLANLLEKGVFKNIITTNFDDLVYQSCARFTKTRPVVFSYGNLSSEITFSSERPQIFKLHGDFLYTSLLNLDDEVNYIPDKRDRYNFLNEKYNMKQAFEQSLYNNSGIIVIGYAGADRSIMETFRKIPKTHYLLWCLIWHEDLDNTPLTYGKLREKYGNGLINLIKERDGFIVKTKGFDEVITKICRTAKINTDNIIANAIDRMFELRKEIYKVEIEPYKNPSYSITHQKTEHTELKKNVNKGFLASSHFFVAYDKQLDPDKKSNNLSEQQKKRIINIARKYYEKSIDSFPELSDVYYNFANLLADELHDGDKAKNNYKKAIELNPKDAYAYNRLGKLLTNTTYTLDEAKQYLDKAINLDADFGFAHYNLGNWYLKNSLIESDDSKKRRFLLDSEKSFETALKNMPEFIHLNITLLAVYKLLKSDKYEKDLIEKVKDKIPTNDYFDLGCFYWVIDKKSSALVNLEKAINDKPVLFKVAESDLNLFDLFNNSEYEELFKELNKNTNN